MQVERMKPMLKAPGTERLKLVFMDCFQVLLSKITCAATPGRCTRKAAGAAPGASASASGQMRGRGRGQKRGRGRHPRQGLVDIARYVIGRH